MIETVLKKRVFESLSDVSRGIEVNQSRCLRMRFNKNRCSKCIDVCKSDAIKIGDGVFINGERCSECMLCVAECPAGSFSIVGFDFYSMISRLRRLHSPVIGCSFMLGLSSHEKTPCAGFLSEEHLVAILSFIDGDLQINLSGCKKCKNDFVADILKERLDTVQSKTSTVFNKRIIPIEDESKLNYREITYDRRGFFSALRKHTLSGVAGLLRETATNGAGQSYSKKALPFKREIINRCLSFHQESIRTELLNNYYYSFAVHDSCNRCFACIGMCPTGALKVNNSELSFSSALCNGCALCVDFCKMRSISIERGFSGHNPYRYSVLKGV